MEKPAFDRYAIIPRAGEPFQPEDDRIAMPLIPLLSPFSPKGFGEKGELFFVLGLRLRPQAQNRGQAVSAGWAGGLFPPFAKGGRKGDLAVGWVARYPTKAFRFNTGKRDDAGQIQERRQQYHRKALDLQSADRGQYYARVREEGDHAMKKQEKNKAHPMRHRSSDSTVWQSSSPQPQGNRERIS